MIGVIEMKREKKDKKKKYIFRSRDRPARLLDPLELHEKAMHSIVLIAALGLALMIMDVLASWNGGDMNMYLDEDRGRIYLLRPESKDSPSRMRVKGKVKTEQGQYEKDFDLTLSPYEPAGKDDAPEDITEKEPAEEDRIMYQLRSIVSGLDSDTSLRRVLLPQSLPGGEKIVWSRRRESHTMLIFAATVAFAFLVYRSRHSPIKKQRQENMESVAEGLPVFLHQLVLLLNAGLILDTAFERVVEQNIRFKKEDPGYFFTRIRNIHGSIANTNASLHRELQQFARESGVSEFLRVSTVISDNVSRGTDLTEKLEEESHALWLARRMKSEERGRLAETKMTLPLSIFLGVLILITVSPALLEMN